MDDQLQQLLDEFKVERKRVLMAGDVFGLMTFYSKHNPGAAISSYEVGEITLHKCRTAALDLPLEVRRSSKEWLEERGYKSLDFGTIPESTQ